ncbi:MAG: LacI family DNA-binding transcriptional regulator [Gemmiger sp.]
MEEGRVRIADIAEELGVSTATVSNVIHGKTKKISAETVRRVQEQLEKRQYIPSMAGILLAQNDSRIIGVIINDHEKYAHRTLEDAFIASSLNCLAAQIERAGRFMMVKLTRNVGEIVRFASMWNLDGMVVIGFCEQDYKSLREAMRIPFVVYDGYLSDPGRICNLRLDDRGGGRQAGEYLYSLGHRQVVCIADNAQCMDLERYLGFCEAFGEERVPLWQVPMDRQQREAYYTQRLAELRGFTAAFAVSDVYAADLMQFLQRQGVKVPEAFSIIGFDDTPLCSFVTPALTTVRQDGEARARLAVELLRAMKAGEAEGQTFCLPVTLVRRASTAPVAK